VKLKAKEKDDGEKEVAQSPVYKAVEQSENLAYLLKNSCDVH